MLGGYTIACVTSSDGYIATAVGGKGGLCCTRLSNKHEGTMSQYLRTLESGRSNERTGKGGEETKHVEQEVDE